MEIQEKLLKFKHHIVFTFAFSLVLFSLIIWAPSFLSVLSYFWPLFLSTALFLGAVVFFGKTSCSTAADARGHKAAEGLLDYVAGQPDHPVETYKTE